MNTVEKDRMMTEAKMQTAALKKINVWKKLAILVSTIGVAMAYGGLSGTPSRLFPSISGILLIITGFAAAVVFNLGIKNGRRNVEKIIRAIDEGRKI
ncbi:hypothetical protein D3Z60_05880 [Lachnospiraceae bacterium]|jgi:hypothetical protein|nr:hypothetical protein [Lachnospiraceae bacterium]